MISLRDKKADITHPPQFHKTEIDAIRAIRMSLKDPNSFIGQFPSDFSLNKLGTYSEDTGQFNLESSILIDDLSTLVEKAD